MLPLTSEQRRQFLSDRALHLILMPTEQCNFRCVYCYEDFARGEMPAAVVAAVKALIERRAPGLEQLSIEWFGGEPLLAYPTVVEVQSLACELASRRPSLHLAGSMTTNGSLLSPSRFRRLLDLRVRTFQVSLDGPREAHDRSRPSRGGRGTFAKVWRHLVAMRDVEDDFTVLVRMHAAEDNLDLLEGFLDELARSFAGDPRFRLSLRPVRRLGGARDDLLAVLDRRGERRLERLKTAARDAGLTLHAGPFAAPGALQGCYAAAASSMVVRANGDLAKCTVALRHPRNRVGTLQHDGTVRLDSDKMLGWMRGVFDRHPESLSCPMKGWAEPEPAAERLVSLRPRGLEDAPSA